LISRLKSSWNYRHKPSNYQ